MSSDDDNRAARSASVAEAAADERPSDPGRVSGSDAELDEVDVRDLLRRALDPPKGTRSPDILPAVQRRIRVESRGKFFADGWSTTIAPRSTYLITSVVMLLVTLALWLLLTPLGVEILR
jgi:hypothetical protein